MYDHRTSDPFLGSEAVATGRVRPGALRTRQFLRLGRDTYIGASCTVDIRVRVRALALRGGRGAVVGGPSAALAWGAECPWDDEELVLPSDRRLARDGVRLRVDRLGVDDVGLRYGTAVTTPLRTAFDLARRGPLSESVAAVDALGRVARVGAADLGRVVDAHPGERGVVLARQVVVLADPLAESLMESRARVGLVLRGVPRPVLQHPVRLPDGRRVRLDMAWPTPPSGRPVAVEYQGEDHRDIRRHGLDIDRAHRLVELGWEIVEMTARQVYHSLDATAAHLRRRLGL